MLATVPIVIHPVTDATPGLLDNFIDLFWRVFPEERRYTRHIKEAALAARLGSDRKVYHLWLVEYEGEFAGFRMFNYVRRFHFGFSGFIGFLPQYRGMGLGSSLQTAIMAQLLEDAAQDGHDDALGLVGELDRPSAATTAEERAVRLQRVNIFRRMGGLILNVDYVEPPLVEGLQVEDPADLIYAKPMPSLLYLIPHDPTLGLDTPTMEQIIRGVYSEAYNLDERSSYMQHALHSLHFPSGIDYATV
jgi:GNAT superfamily N-acetyltransferase